MRFLSIPLLLCCLQASAQSPANGHSHNDYEQNIPFYRAYYAGMGSIEADVFLRNGTLYVAHNKEDIQPSRTLEALYIKPLSERKDTGRVLQLLVDIKERYEDVIPALVKTLQGYKLPNVRIVLSGGTPPPEKYTDYPDYILYDGRPNINYTPAQLQRVEMISDNLAGHTVWNGKGTPTPEDGQKLRAIIQSAHDKGKKFRFWATKDSPNTWSELEKLGADWIGTDHPEDLQKFYAHRDKLQFTQTKPYQPYQPTYKSDGAQKKVKNVILLIGDGMGLTQIQAALTANGGKLNLAMFKHLGFSRTEAVNSDITDSAAGGTAMATGNKTNNRYVGTDANGQAVASIPDTLAKHGIKSGIISSGDITDATPAAFYAHQTERSKSKEIARDFLQSHVDVLVGSNRKSFDGLIPQLEQKGYHYAADLNAFEAAKDGKQLVLLEDTVCRPVKDGRGDMLQRSLRKTISLLGNRFFIMAEGAQIDYGGHANDLPYVITELHDFDRMVGDAMRFADQHGETLVIVTADHETGGLSLLDANLKKGFVSGHFSSDDHTNVMVPVFAYGPGAEAFTGIYENTEIFRRIVQLMTRK